MHRLFCRKVVKGQDYQVLVHNKKGGVQECHSAQGVELR